MEPIRDCKDKLEGVAREILGAMSALNMEPEPLDPPTGVYLSSRDKWANHALRHLEAAFDLLKEYRDPRPGSGGGGGLVVVIEAGVASVKEKKS